MRHYGKTLGRLKPSIEWYMHVSIYKKLEKVNAIVHTHSPYTLDIAVSVIDKFQYRREEAVLPNTLMLWVGDNQSLAGCRLPGDLVL